MLRQQIINLIKQPLPQRLIQAPPQLAHKVIQRRQIINRAAGLKALEESAFSPHRCGVFWCAAEQRANARTMGLAQ